MAYNIETRRRFGELFIEKSKSLYPGELSYEKVKYWNETRKVILTCNKHGDFTAIPKSHLTKGKCCKFCAKESYRKLKGVDRSSAIREFRSIHGDKYEYKEIPEFLNNDTKIEISCEKHGAFMQSVGSHKSGRGCRSCGYENAGGNGSYNDKTLSRFENIPLAKLYLIELFNGQERFMKVGITLRNPRDRIRSTVAYKGVSIMEMELPLDLAYELEQFILSVITPYKPKNKFSGHTECFKSIFLQELTA